MTLPVIFHELAENELNEAAEYYAQARPGLGEAFLTEVQGAVDALAATPLAGQAVEGEVRWWLVRRFPYSVFYRATRPTHGPWSCFRSHATASLEFTPTPRPVLGRGVSESRWL